MAPNFFETCFEVLETSFRAKICTNFPKICANSSQICTNCPKICTKSPKRFSKNIVTRFLNNFHQKFRKGVGRQKGLARRNPSYARDWGLFSAPFFPCPWRRRGTHFWRIFWTVFGGLLVANPLSRQPLFETSDFRFPEGQRHTN